MFSAIDDDEEDYLASVISLIIHSSDEMNECLATLGLELLRPASPVGGTPKDKNDTDKGRDNLFVRQLVV